MAFTVRKITHRPWPVTITLMEADAAGVVHEVKNTFVGHFRPFTEEEFEAVMKESALIVPAPDAQEERLPMPVVLKRNAFIFSRLLVGWGPEVRDEHGASVPYSAEALSALVTGPDGRAVSIALNTALTQIRHGVAPEKNVETSPAPGQEICADEMAPTS